MKLLHELRRRQMFRLVGLYIVGAWLVIQVADIAFPAWGIPDSAMRFLFYAALLCFPIALVFGWIFDIRRDGIYRTRKAGPDEIVDVRMRWQDYIILAALAGIGIYVLLTSAERIRTEPDAEPLAQVAEVERYENSVAVLPFENLDPNPDTGYFSDGVADEILSRLANIGELFVVSRGTSFAFRQSEDSNVEISKELRVQYLLRGTARRDGDLVRVTARLVDERGSIVWSQPFDQKIEQIFTIQSEIADAVAQRVAEKVVPAIAPLTARSTENIEAYSDFLLGKAIFHARAPGWQLKATELFRNVIALDPDFAPSYAFLAISTGLLGWASLDWEEIETLARTALELDPDLAEAHAAMGLVHRHKYHDHEATISAFGRAVELDPSLNIASIQLGFALEREGRIREGNLVLQKGLERDPLNPTLLTNVAHRYVTDGEFERGEKLMLRLLQLPQLPAYAYRHIANLYRNGGKFDESIKWRKEQVLTVFDGTSEHGPEALSHYLMELATTYLALGMLDEAEYLMEQAVEAEPDRYRRSYGQALYCSLANDTFCLGEQLQSVVESRSDTELTPRNANWYPARIGRLYINFGHIEKGTEFLRSWIDLYKLNDWDIKSGEEIESLQYLVLGLRETEIGENVELLFEEVSHELELETDRFDIISPQRFMNIAVNRWLLGDREGAVESVRNAIDSGWINLHSSRHHPLRRDLLALPELQDDLARLELEIQRQRSLVEAEDATGSFQDELANGIAKLEPLPEER